MNPTIETPLFRGATVRLTAVDPEKDAQVETPWTLNPDFAGLLRSQPIRPMLPRELKKLHEEQEKAAAEKHRLFHFAVRTNADDRLIGFARINNVAWHDGAADLELALGEPELQARYEPEILDLMLAFAFDELGLECLLAWAPEYQTARIALLEGAGFTLDVRQREMAYRGGRFWDLLLMTLMKSDWIARRGEVTQ